MREQDIFWSDEDGCFIACVPDLGNCATWGMTHEEVDRIGLTDLLSPAARNPNNAWA